MAGRRWWLVPVVMAVVLSAPDVVHAHAERPSFFPEGDGAVPEYRTTGPSLVVCAPNSKKRIRKLPKGKVRRRNARLLKRCRFSEIQKAVDAAANGTRILLLPGRYREPSSREVPYPDSRCEHLLVDEGGPRRVGQSVRKAASYEYELCSPNSNAMIAILGDSDDPDRRCDIKCDIQIEGTGSKPRHVLIEGDKRHLNVIKADRADGVHLTNFTIQFSDFNNIYVHETDGFAFTNIVSRWSHEYGFLSFTSDHGLYKDNVAYGHGDSGIYPGSGPQTQGGGYGIVVEGNDLFGSLQGTASSAGDNVLYRDNDIHDNGTGFVTDSFSPGHPGSPENHAAWVDNRIYDNNRDDFYSAERDEYCRNPAPDRDLRIVCPAIQVPVGVGVLIAGGNENLTENNEIRGHRRYGVMQFFVEAAFRGELDPAKQFDTSHANVARANRMSGNAIDFWWDEQGSGNCWQDNVAAGEGGAIHSDPATLPACPGSAIPLPVNVLKHATLVPCAAWDPETLPDPPACDWMSLPSERALRRAVSRGQAQPVVAPALPAVLSGPLAWQAPPAVMEHPTLPGHRVLTGTLVNRSVLPVELDGTELRALDAANRRIASATVFASGFAPVVHLWNRRLGPPGYDLERVGKLLRLAPGRTTPVTVAWKRGEPAALDYGAGRLLLG